MGTSASFSLCQSVSSVKIKKCNKKIIPESLPQKNTKIFNVSLETLRENGQTVCGVPGIVHSIVEYLDKYGLEQKGLFRVSSSVNKLKDLKAKYDGGEKVNLTEEGDIESAAGVLKLFLRELPKSVIPDPLHVCFMGAFKGNKDKTELNQHLKKLLGDLPQEHYSVLRYLCNFLQRVASHSQSNQMTMENLAVVFGPCFFHVPFGSSMQEEQSLCNSLLLHILKNFTVLMEDAVGNRTEEGPEPTDTEGSCTEMSNVNKDMSATEENTVTPNAPASYPCAQLVKRRTPVPTPRTRVPVSSLGTADQGSPTSWEIHVAEVPENSMAMSPPIMSTTGFTNIQAKGSAAIMESSPEEGELVQEDSLTISKQHFIRHIIEKHDIHRGLSLTALSARERRRLLRQQEDACRLKEMDGKNKEKLPCHAVFGEEGQLRLKETMPHAEKKALEDLEKIIEDSFKPKRSKSSSETSTEHDQDQDYSKDMENKMESLSACQMNAGLSESRHVQNASFQSKEILDFQNSTAHSLNEDKVELQDSNELVEDDPTGSTQLQPIADNTTPAATEESNASSKGTIQDDSSLLKLQALEVDLCSSFLPAQEDDAQLQHPKEHSLQAGHAAQGEDANTREAQPAFRNCQNEADIQAEAQQCPGTSRLLHHITDGDNPQPSPRCPSFSQSQRFNTDPESAPSPPCSQQFRMSRGIVRGDPPETVKEPVSVTLLTKHIQNVKKTIRKYEETFEQERKYRPSHNDKTANPEIFKLMNDLAKSRKQLKDLKLKMSVKELREQGSQQRELCRVNSGQQGAVELQQKPCLEETVESLIMRLREKRTALGLPENMKEMTQKQMALEKVTLQKCLLYFESLHGRPGTKQERNLMKPLYDRYRMIKQFLCATSSITTIEEEGSDEENMQHNPLPPSRIISQNSSDESLCPYEEDNEPTFVSPLDEMKAVRQTVTMPNLHEASVPELLEHLRETRAEKKRLRKALRDYEDQFLRQMGRTAQKEDRIPMAEEYCEFKQIKAKLKLLEVLVSKRGAAQTT
ncbi:protein FAM13C-like isoform X1 [Acipenser ruthenus]|uniref:protein FAM13C-like isoform X1 n=1 Tax=Acipenser ruthenus TaxID=7906 RepID=UPI002741FE28|nr:protein FAM13C-like isoform X1 [Acipenser ruthenus]